MEKDLKFSSDVCTSRVQSERLLTLGLKKETADMCWQTTTLNGEPITYPSQDVWLNGSIITNNHFPAWSLHRLIEMMPKNIAIDGDTAYPLYIQKRSDGKWCVGYQGWYDCVGDLYDSVIWIYQLLISEGYLDEFCNKG